MDACQELWPYEIQGPVKYLKKLGRGEISTAYEAQLPTGTICAAKRPSDSRDPDFFRECIFFSQLRHPNIVSFIGVHGIGTTSPALLVELMNCSLANYLSCRSSVPVEALLTILADTARGMNHLHSLSPPIEHRDITTINILLSFGPLKAKLSCFNSAETKPDPTTVFAYDIRQFGYVLRISAKHDSLREFFGSLTRLAADCASEDVTLRPSASVILDRLQHFLCEYLFVTIQLAMRGSYEYTMRLLGRSIADFHVNVPTKLCGSTFVYH